MCLVCLGHGRMLFALSESCRTVLCQRTIITICDRALGIGKVGKCSLSLLDKIGVSIERLNMPADNILEELHWWFFNSLYQMLAETVCIILLLPTSTGPALHIHDKGAMHVRLPQCHPQPLEGSLKWCQLPRLSGTEVILKSCHLHFKSRIHLGNQKPDELIKTWMKKVL